MGGAQLCPQRGAATAAALTPAQPWHFLGVLQPNPSSAIPPWEHSRTETRVREFQGVSPSFALGLASSWELGELVLDESSFLTLCVMNAIPVQHHTLQLSLLQGHWHQLSPCCLNTNPKYPKRDQNPT